MVIRKDHDVPRVYVGFYPPSFQDWLVTITFVIFFLQHAEFGTFLHAGPGGYRHAGTFALFCVTIRLLQEKSTY